jgi:hypothetical protein
MLWRSFSSKSFQVYFKRIFLPVTPVSLAIRASVTFVMTSRPSQFPNNFFNLHSHFLHAEHLNKSLIGDSVWLKSSLFYLTIQVESQIPLSKSTTLLNLLYVQVSF